MEAQKSSRTNPCLSAFLFAFWGHSFLVLLNSPTFLFRKKYKTNSHAHLYHYKYILLLSQISFHPSLLCSSSSSSCSASKHWEMHLYNAWLPPPVAQETKREKDSFSRVVRSVKDSLKPDDPDSVYSTLKWISVIDLWAFFQFSFCFCWSLFFLIITLNFGSF